MEASSSLPGKDSDKKPDGGQIADFEKSKLKTTAIIIKCTLPERKGMQ